MDRRNRRSTRVLVDQTFLESLRALESLYVSGGGESTANEGKRASSVPSSGFVWDETRKEEQAAATLIDARPLADRMLTAADQVQDKYLETACVLHEGRERIKALQADTRRIVEAASAFLFGGDWFGSEDYTDIHVTGPQAIEFCNLLDSLAKAVKSARTPTEFEKDRVTT